MVVLLGSKFYPPTLYLLLFKGLKIPNFFRKTFLAGTFEVNYTYFHKKKAPRVLEYMTKIWIELDFVSVSWQYVKLYSSTRGLTRIWKTKLYWIHTKITLDL